MFERSDEWNKPIAKFKLVVQRLEPVYTETFQRNGNAWFELYNGELPFDRNSDDPAANADHKGRIWEKTLTLLDGKYRYQVQESTPTGFKNVYSEWQHLELPTPAQAPPLPPGHMYA